MQCTTQEAGATWGLMQHKWKRWSERRWRVSWAAPALDHARWPEKTQKERTLSESVWDSSTSMMMATMISSDDDDEDEMLMLMLKVSDSSFGDHYIVIPSQLHGIATQVVMRWLTTPHWWTPVWTSKTCHAELKWIENWQRDCFPLELTLKVHQDSLSAVQFRNDLTRDFNVKLLGTRYIPVSRKWLQWSSTRCNSHFSLDLWMLRVNQASFTDARSQVCR